MLSLSKGTHTYTHIVHVPIVKMIQCNNILFPLYSHDQHKLIKKLSHNEQVILPGSIATQKVSVLCMYSREREIFASYHYLSIHSIPQQPTLNKLDTKAIYMQTL